MLKQPTIEPLGWGIMGWRRRTRAAIRMARIFIHMLHVSLIMPFVFKNSDHQSRDAHIKQWSQAVLNFLGIQLVVHGELAPTHALVVSNHVSWLDIMTINAWQCCRFVSKIEVSKWPLIGNVVTLANTMYVDRSKRHDAARVLKEMTSNLQAGHSVVVFPEGTTGTGPQLLRFHASLLQAAINAQVDIQPIVIRYEDSHHLFSPAPVYVGDTHLFQSMWWIACTENLIAHVYVMPCVQATAKDRRVLCEHMQQQAAHVLFSTSQTILSKRVQT